MKLMCEKIIVSVLEFFFYANDIKKSLILINSLVTNICSMHDFL
jgi:hypothetical protein